MGYGTEMCFKAAISTKYRKCNHTVDGVEKTYHGELKPNGPNCANPKTNTSVSAKVVSGFGPDCVTAGKK